jgi:sugar/nucleoside kinase (ribokinase family)
LNGKNNLLLKYIEKNMKLLVVGSVAFDAIETPFGKTDKILGGAATYIGITSSILGVKSGIVSVVGGDFPQEYLDMFTNREVNIEGIEIVKEGKHSSGQENTTMT